MGWLRFFRRTRADLDHAEEFHAHLQIEIDDNIARGMAPEEARRAARLRFGNLTLLREEIYRMNHIDVLLQDLRYGLGQLRRSPGFTLVALLTLALGIGANTAVFSVMNAALLRFLPVHDPERLVFLNTTNSIEAQSGDGDTSLTDYIFEQMRTQRQVFSDLVGFAPLAVNRVAVQYGSEPEEAQVELVSGDFFSGLGVRPVLGRTFTLADEANHAAFAVVSYGYWSSRFGRDPSVLGRPLDINGVPFTIIGIAAPGFIGVENKKASEVWIPLQTRADMQPWGASPGSGISLYGTAPRWWCLKVIGRLAPGVTEKQALARVGPLFQRAAIEGVKRRFTKESMPRLYFTPAHGIDGMQDDYGRPLAVLLVMVALVLLIACANIAMLLIARNTARQREFSVRLALGAGRVRLFRQLLTESMLLVAAGSLVAWVFALWATKALATWAHLELSFAPDHTVLLFTASLSIAVALAFGLAPLRTIVHLPVGNALKTSAAVSSQDVTKRRGRQIVVAIQTAFCLALLVGAGLLLDTLRNLEAVNLGIHTSGLLVFGVSPQNVHSNDQAIHFYQALLNRLRAIPGIESVTLMRHRIGSGWTSNSSVLVDGVDPHGDGNSGVRWNDVGPDYFHVLGGLILRGRDFTDADTANSQRVAIVNQTFVDNYLHGRDPLGHKITEGDTSPATIVGVVHNIKYSGVRETDMPMAWFPYTQAAAVSGMHVELRTEGDPARMLPAVRRAMHDFAPELALLQPMTQQEQYERSYSDSRLVARLAIFFGSLAALLVAIGLYGTLSYTVSRRTAEVGVRMALGARRSQVVWMVLRGSLILSLAGVLLGLPLAIAGTHFLRSMLFGVKPGDPWIFISALALLLSIALAASSIPARRAASVDPVVALRHE